MKLVKFHDENGWKKQAWIREDMPDDQAYMGIPQNIPDVRQIDMEETLRELNNLLFDRGIFTLKDVQQKHNQLRSAVEQCFFPKVLQLYKEQLNQEVSNGQRRFN